MSPLDHALHCAACHGWAVYPVGFNKTPRTPNGHKAASTDPDRIRAMAAQFGFMLIGIATGEVSNLAVLDIDCQHGGFVWYEANRERLPKTRAHRTRSGGIHLYFKHLPGLRCSTSKVAAGIDVRAEGGSIIYWPATGLEVLCDAPLADWPQWAVGRPAAATAPPPLPVFNGDRAERRYVEAAIRGAVGQVASALPGRRNDTLNSATFGLMRLADGRVLSARDVALAMAHAGIAAGLEPAEVEATIASAIGSRGQA